MMASGSTDGSETCNSLVATSLTQSVEPGRGTRSILTPSCWNQPSLGAVANGAAAELMVLAHQPTRTVCTCAVALLAATARPRVTVAQAINRCITRLLP